MSSPSSSRLVAALLAVIGALVLVVGVLVADRHRLTTGLADAKAAQSAQSGSPAAAEPAPANKAATITDPQQLSLIRAQQHRDPKDPQATGEVDAKVVMVVYSDFGCPYCTLFAQKVEPGLEDLLADGTLRIEWRDLAQITPTSGLAAQAGRAAGAQGRFWEFHNALYAAADPTAHPVYSEESLVEFAKNAGVPDLDAFRTAMTSDETVAAVEKAKTDAHAIGITGTPFLFIGDTFISGYKDLDFVRNTVLDQAAKADK